MDNNSTGGRYKHDTPCISGAALMSTLFLERLEKLKSILASVFMKQIFIGDGVGLIQI
jgi:hypothetical protein